MQSYSGFFLKHNQTLSAKLIYMTAMQQVINELYLEWKSLSKNLTGYATQDKQNLYLERYKTISKMLTDLLKDYGQKTKN